MNAYFVASAAGEAAVAGEVVALPRLSWPGTVEDKKV